jgi:hypothetical protein
MPVAKVMLAAAGWESVTFPLGSVNWSAKLTDKFEPAAGGAVVLGLNRMLPFEIVHVPTVTLDCVALTGVAGFPAASRSVQTVFIITPMAGRADDGVAVVVLAAVERVTPEGAKRITNCAVFGAVPEGS